MKATIRSTENLVRLDGQLCRVWKGTTEKGIAITLFVVRICIDDTLDDAELALSLIHMGTPEIKSASGGKDDGSWQLP